MIVRKLLGWLLNLSLLGSSLRASPPIVSVAPFRNTLGSGSWTTPINLSHSGSASNPELIIDSTGHFHAVWLDAYAGYVNSESDDGKSWSKPSAVSFPFGVKDSAPRLVADSQGQIHAFWTDKTNGLWYSRVTSDGFGNGAVWQPAISLADTVVYFDVAADQAGTIHLVYLEGVAKPPLTSTLPAGIYYRAASASGAKWSNVQILYQSPYLRSVTSDQTNVRIALSDDGGIVYVVWDNRPIKRIVFSRSGDGGKSWIDPVALKQPDASQGGAAPYNGNLIVADNNLFLIWQTAAAGAACTLSSQLSRDQGATWSQAVTVYKSLASCPQDNRLALTADKAVIIASNLASQVVLAAWNGSEWSNPQSVPSSFSDPDLLNPVTLSCQTVSLDKTSRLFAIGCDQAGGDIWLTSQPLATVADWFPPPTRWGTPGLIVTTTSDISSVSIVADRAAELNAMWVQSYQSNDVITSTISYSTWDGQHWAQPVQVLTAPQEKIDQLDTATDGQRLFVVWSQGPLGRMYFSWANLATAAVPSEWSHPQQLLLNQTAATTPKLIVDATGVVSVAYAVPVNENRGVYLIRSMDGGSSWSDPVRVFDATAAGWNMASAPQLAASSGGWWNATWMKYPLPGSFGPLTIYAGQSRNGGITWSEPSQLAEGDITWSLVIGDSGSVVHRFWQISQGNQRIVWHQFSDDAGAAWSQPASITGLGTYVGTPAVAVDVAGQLHLLQARLGASNTLDILYWLWDLGSWTSQDSLAINDASAVAPDYVAAAVSPAGQLVVVYPGLVQNAGLGNMLHALYASSRSVELPAVTATPQEAPTAVTIGSAPPTITAIAVATPTAIAAANNPTDVAGPIPARTSNPWLSVVVPGGIVGVLIAVFFAYRLFTARRG